MSWVFRLFAAILSILNIIAAQLRSDGESERDYGHIQKKKNQRKNEKNMYSR